MVEYQTVASVSNEAPGEMKLGVLDDKEVVVANIDGEDFAFGNACPHAASPLVDGEVVGAIVTCRWYATAFNVKTGEAQQGGVTDDPVPNYEICLEGNDIQIRMP